MEKVYYNGIEIRIKSTRSYRLTYRVLRVEHAIVFNIPYSAPQDIIKKEINKIISEVIEKEELNKYQDGGFLLLWGEKVPLCIYETEKACIAMCNKKIYFGLTQGRFDNSARKIVKEFYRIRLLKYLSEHIPIMEKKVGIRCTSFKITNMISAWGKCLLETKKILFSSNLATQTPKFIDMVIVHELGHILYNNHGKEFHNYMNKYVPNNKQLLKNR